MNSEQILHQRLNTQGLFPIRFSNAPEIVQTLSAVQAQDYSGVKWGIAQRLKKAREEKIDHALDKGKIIRTHIMRPTWHLVAPEDLRWMQMLTSPRVKQIMNHYNRRLGLTEKVFEKTNRIIEKSLKGENYLTRQELNVEFKKEGIICNVQKLAHIVAEAELNALICNGPRKGKQFTYGLVEERIPETKTLTREEALRELVTRYFTSHGPATIADFTWWSGLSMGDAKKGIELAGNELREEKVNDVRFWMDKKQMKVKKDTEKVYLLPNYDEYTIGYKSKHALYILPRTTIFTGTGFYHTIVQDGMVIGTWKRELLKNKIRVMVKPLTKMNTGQRERLEKEIQRYGDFFGINAQWD